MSTYSEESSIQVLLHTLEKYQNFISEISEGVWRLETVHPVPCGITIEEQIESYFEMGYLAEANLAMAKMYGFEKVDDLKGMPLKELLIPEDQRNQEYLKAFIQSGYRLKDAESVEKDRHGEIRYFLNNLFGILENGCLTGAWGTQRDITDFRSLEEKLKEAAGRAGEANRNKTTFLANLSHEIRTPLSVILGFADLTLESRALEEDTRANIQVIRKNAEQLANMLGEVLDISKIEASRMEIEKSRFALLPMLNEAISSMSLRAREKHLKLNLGVCGPLPKTISSDLSKLRQILMNLLSNAIKFTERGHVTLSVRLVSDPLPGREIMLEFSVTDSGIGIPEGERHRLFLPFSQIECPTKYGGSGLGLNLSKRLANALGGDLSLLRSRSGEGSTFALCLPGGELKGDLVTENLGELVPQNSSASAPYNQLNGKRVLLVEDSEDNQILITRFLAAVGMQVEVAGNGREGIDKAQSGHYDLIVMDIQMPGMDGHEAARTMREYGYDKPIIALTARALKEDKELAYANGFSEYLTKPIDRSVLIHTLEERLSAMEMH